MYVAQGEAADLPELPYFSAEPAVDPSLYETTILNSKSTPLLRKQAAILHARENRRRSSKLRSRFPNQNKISRGQDVAFFSWGRRLFDI